MMNRAFTSVFVVILVISILEVTTFKSNENSKEHDEDSHDDFQEFHDEPAEEYSEAVNSPHTHGGDADDVAEDIEIRQPTSGKPSGGLRATPLNMPPVRFTFCVSCGYRQAFDQLSQILREKFPGIEIEGSNYAPSPLKAFVAQLIGFGKIALIVMIIMGRDPFPSLGLQTPRFFTWMLANKLSSCLMLFMLSNSIEGMMMSTGAFEIHIGTEQIWSKLESGRPPSPGELVQAVESYVELRGQAGSAAKLTGASFNFAGSDEN